MTIGSIGRSALPPYSRPNVADVPVPDVQDDTAGSLTPGPRDLIGRLPAARDIGSEDDRSTSVLGLFAQARKDVLTDPSLRVAEDDPDTAVDESKVPGGAAGGAIGASDELHDLSELTPEEQETVRTLQARDSEVRAHEAAHAAAGGALAGSPSYEYQTGPDGRRYAVGGEVQIKTGGGGTPEERLRNAAKVRAAALAPASPSGADRSVASAAAAEATRARMDQTAARRSEPVEGPGTPGPGVVGSHYAGAHQHREGSLSIVA